MTTLCIILLYTTSIVHISILYSSAACAVEITSANALMKLSPPWNNLGSLPAAFSGKIRSQLRSGGLVARRGLRRASICIYRCIVGVLGCSGALATARSALAAPCVEPSRVESNEKMRGKCGSVKWST
ncbi:hypothetical protein PF003_g35536 [Phytophthora fragariae]|nr:hypothetical protein PF003_g35536 [Phytophthora fragariae]